MEKPKMKKWGHRKATEDEGVPRNTGIVLIKIPEWISIAGCVPIKKNLTEEKYGGENKKNWENDKKNSVVSRHTIFVQLPPNYQ